MQSTRRSSPKGTVKNTTIIILLISILILTVSFNKQKSVNDMLYQTVQNQTSSIKHLKTENTDLNTQVYQLTQYKQKLEEHNKELEEEKKKLEDKLKSTNKTTTQTQSKKTLGGSFKSYTDYKCLLRSSAQWKLQEKAYTDENGLRKIGDAYLVALGSYYGTTLGTKYKVTLSNGNVFNIILCDCKQDRHTDSKNQACLINGSLLEFYVDSSKLPKSAKLSGSIGSISFFSGDVVSIVQI